MGEPGKAVNGLSTDPKNRIIFLDDQGRIHSKPYFDEHDTTAKVCRIERGPVTLYPEDTITVTLPDNLQNRDIFVTPKKGFDGIFQARMILASTKKKIMTSNTHQQ